MARTPSDAELVERQRKGDEQAFEALFERYCPLVKNRAAQGEEAGLAYEDLLQEGMVGLFKAVRAYDPSKSVPFAAFASQVVENQIADAIKKMRRKKHRILSDALSLQKLRDSGAEKALPQVDEEELILQKLLAKDRRLALGRALRARLSAAEYEVLNLRLAARSYAQIARELGLSEKQVDNCLQRAKRKLRRLPLVV